MRRKEGRALSAATRAKLEEAIQHWQNAQTVVRSLLADDDEEKAAKVLASWAAADTRL